MTLASRLGLGSSGVIAFVGAGGKTSIMLLLGEELANNKSSVLMGTTTRMGAGQAPSWATLITCPDHIGSGAQFLAEKIDGPKVIGSDPAVFDGAASQSDFVLVEADGARRKQIKAPAGHEPVIPSLTTTVVVVAGIDAIGRPLSEVSHRAELVASVTGLEVDDTVTSEALATLVTSDRGGLAKVPTQADVVVALSTRMNTDPKTLETRLASMISEHPRVARTVIFTVPAGVAPK